MLQPMNMHVTARLAERLKLLPVWARFKKPSIVKNPFIISMLSNVKCVHHPSIKAALQVTDSMSTGLMTLWGGGGEKEAI